MNFIELVTLSVILGVLIGLGLQALFCMSTIKALKLVPEEHYIFPRWFVWLTLVPVVSLVFDWLMLPFGIPRALAQTVVGNKMAERRAKGLYFLGLAIVLLFSIQILLGLMSLLPFHFFHTSYSTIDLLIVAYAIWIIYRIEVVLFRRAYLDAPLAGGRSLSQ